MKRSTGERRWMVVALAVLTATAGVLAGGSAGASSARRSSSSAPRAGVSVQVTIVAQGLNNPRGLAWSGGGLYVTEAGVGGSDCPKGATGPEGGPLCVGRTGAVDVFRNGVRRRVLSGLISVADIPGGLAAEGVADVAATKSGLKVVFGESVLGVLTALPKGASFARPISAALRVELGRLAFVSRGHLGIIADVGDADFAWTGVHQDRVPSQFPDANPNALLVAGPTTYIVDAGSNTLDSVDAFGHVKQLAFFPNPVKSDAVPSCVAAGPDGNLYVGQLAPGAPKNGGKVFRYDPKTRRLSVWKTGFNVVDGCGFDKAGNFYAVEFQANGFNPGPTGNPAGDIIKIAKNGSRTVLGAGKLFYPQGFAVNNQGDIYISNWSILTGTPAHPGMPTGQVVKIHQLP